jgi:hypothetical protein
MLFVPGRMAHVSPPAGRRGGHCPVSCSTGCKGCPRALGRSVTTPPRPARGPPTTTSNGRRRGVQRRDALPLPLAQQRFPPPPGPGRPRAGGCRAVVQLLGASPGAGLRRCSPPCPAAVHPAVALPVASACGRRQRPCHRGAAPCPDVGLVRGLAGARRRPLCCRCCSPGWVRWRVVGGLVIRWFLACKLFCRCWAVLGPGRAAPGQGCSPPAGASGRWGVVAGPGRAGLLRVRHRAPARAGLARTRARRPPGFLALVHLAGRARGARPAPTPSAHNMARRPTNAASSAAAPSPAGTAPSGTPAARGPASRSRTTYVAGVLLDRLSSPCQL